jgi:aerobic-type carbon monoxide dehydrogenase small subunit (CoxS/CutS family)
MGSQEIRVQETAQLIGFRVNGQTHQLMVEPHWTLSFVLRTKLGLTGTKEACDEGACGSCTVVVDGQAVPSCMMLAIEQDGKHIETIEGLSGQGRLHPIQEAWLEEYGAQCGFCSPGMIMSAKALLDKNPQPSSDEIKAALAGNLCICSNYDHIINAIMVASEKLRRR